MVVDYRLALVGAFYGLMVVGCWLVRLFFLLTLPGFVQGDGDGLLLRLTRLDFLFDVRADCLFA
jgi:hypothetical protein